MKVQSRLFYERLCSTSDDARVEIMVVKGGATDATPRGDSISPAEWRTGAVPNFWQWRWSRGLIGKFSITQALPLRWAQPQIIGLRVLLGVSFQSYLVIVNSKHSLEFVSLNQFGWMLDFVRTMWFGSFVMIVMELWSDDYNYIKFFIKLVNI